MRTAETTLKNDLINILNEFLKNGTFSKNARYWWKSEINILRKMENSKNKYEKTVAANTIDFLCSYCYETGKEYMLKRKFDFAINIYLAGIIILPESKYFYQQLSRIKIFGDNHELYYSIQDKPTKVA